ncbi:MAG: UDP-N-acetylmuramoyl-L-alanyl-D-glutamate--2,6-diaminopimelate ligase, partial [Alphaproteobacteria bacterium]|nr:UDP-N-acetylmuramoyl-L-alanyl-D-glutamate--2,6-diaminopimelate ligase [Alphaproteobacteria bacterium]
MLLRDLLPTHRLDAQLGEHSVLGLSADSRKIKAGFVFFAIPGTKVDGLSFAQQAAQQGALAIIAAQSATSQIGNVPIIGVEDVRLALAQAAARFYPRQPATIAAVTGTSGKTSVSVFTRQIWAH